MNISLHCPIRIIADFDKLPGHVRLDVEIALRFVFYIENFQENNWQELDLADTLSCKKMSFFKVTVITTIIALAGIHEKHSSRNDSASRLSQK